MMDAMDAVEFLDKIDRFSQIGSTGEKIRYTDYRKAGDNVGAVKFVKQWAVAHPAKTRQSELLKHFPEAALTQDGALTICPLAVSAAYRDKNGLCANSSEKCDDCCRKFWLAEVEE